MAIEIDNITQVQPEIPDAGAPPQQVTPNPIQQTPYMSPVVLTSRMAKDQSKKNLAELSRLTGRQYTF